ncbi:MAG: threonine--tRNA ligase [Acidobacteria bacterium]|nr:threonine--tRNA ligase [Acidobacteriota bacterium]
MSQITVTLPDGSTRAASAGAAVSAVAADISPRLARQALAAIVDGRMVDLSYPLEGDAAVRFVTPDAPEALQLYRHSTAHLLAAAVTALFPEAQCGIGPAIDEGFFYDFVVDRPFVPEDLEAIERKMGELAKQNLRYERKMMSKAEAKAYFDGRGEPLKVQLIEEKGGPIVSCYTIEDAFIDFCTGPHVPSTGRLKAFKVLHSSGAYWKGDSRNQPMQRIYGTAFFKASALTAHLTRIEEAKKRDHRRLGKDLGLFTFHPWAPGAPFWQAKGTTLYRLLSDYMRDALSGEDYLEVRTPLVFNKALWETSGHWDHYRENMFLLASDGEPPAPATGNGGGPSAAEDRDGAQFALKAMNCPGHMLMFASEGRSYRDLPLRFHDQGVLHRQEASGVLSGLTRVRQFSQDDAHCFITEDQIGEEVERLLRLIDRVYGDFGLDYAIELSTRPEDYLGELETWNHAEAQLRGAIEAAGRPFTVSEGDGSFYGPKIDVHVTDAIGRRWQCATIQLDYQMPQRFGLKYVGADNADHTPVLIHRAIFGSFERFIALLIEQYAGAFPLWLAPVQVRILNIADRHAEYGRTVQERLAGAGLRVELDDRREKIGLKIREAQLQKIPRMLVIGDREVENGTVAVRSRTQGDLGASALDELIRTLEEEVRLKRTPATE